MHQLFSEMKTFYPLPTRAALFARKRGKKRLKWGGTYCHTRTHVDTRWNASTISTRIVAANNVHDHSGPEKYVDQNTPAISDSIGTVALSYPGSSNVPKSGIDLFGIAIEFGVFPEKGPMSYLAPGGCESICTVTVLLLKRVAHPLHREEEPASEKTRSKSRDDLHKPPFHEPVWTWKDLLMQRPLRLDA
jgi:hypothetical protein